MDQLKQCGIDLDDAGYIQFTKQGISRKWFLPRFPLSEGYVGTNTILEVREEQWKDGVDARIKYSLECSAAILMVRIQARPRTNILRLCYSLSGEDEFKGRDGEQRICYGGYVMHSKGISELQLSQFDRLLHSFVPSKDYYQAAECQGKKFIGPIILPNDENGVVLGAYEHGAAAPDHYLQWERTEEGVTLWSSKGNYFGGQKVAEYVAPWIELGIAMDEESMFRGYRSFLLEDMAVSADSRKPYIFFNSWHNQEGQKYFNGNSYLKDMNQEFTLRDIEIAHQMGVEVYVIDVGWFLRTGDWNPNEAFFPDGMKRVKEKLDEYGMKLGLWVNPIVAAKNSKAYTEHRDCAMNWFDYERSWGEIWETEESYGMCVVSDYGEWVLEKLVQLHETLGVTYFKWDAVVQYGCTSPHHHHGTKDNDPQERGDAYAYRICLELTRIAAELNRRCPGTVVEFDITEDGRFMGLGFLAAGKYFHMNNGPYFSDFDIPQNVQILPNTVNVFFYPGAARSQVCRQFVRYDKYIPSILFLTNFLPHGSELSQKNAMAALALGGNGIWGFLQELEQKDIERWAEFISKYKQVREDITLAYPVQKGKIGGTPEIHEKLNADTGRGVVVFFTNDAGILGMNGEIFTHITQPLKVTPKEISGADEFEILEDNRVRLSVMLEANEATTVFFL